MAGKTIRLSKKMIDALGTTIVINGRDAMIMSHPKTQHALRLKGLADENGYLTDQGRFVAYLASLGGKVHAWDRETLDAGTRAWLRGRAKDSGSSALAAVELPTDQDDREQAAKERDMTHPMLVEAPKCTKILDGELRIDGSQDDATCKREEGHRGLHRDSWAIHDDTLKWGDDVCLPVA